MARRIYWLSTLTPHAATASAFLKEVIDALGVELG
jgi:hypothetical protein